MRNQDKEKLVGDWLKFASENLLFAKTGMKHEFSPYHTVCYLCQGSCEKYLRAYLIWKGWELKKVHDLSKLLDFCQEFDESFSTLFAECELLNEYIIEGRYPGDLPFENIVEDDAKEAVEAAEKIEKFVLDRIDLINNSKSNKDFSGPAINAN